VAEIFSKTGSSNRLLTVMIVVASVVVITVFGPELKRGIAAQLFETRAARPPLNSAQRRNRELYWAARSVYNPRVGRSTSAARPRLEE